MASSASHKAVYKNNCHVKGREVYLIILTLVMILQHPHWERRAERSAHHWVLPVNANILTVLPLRKVLSP